MNKMSRICCLLILIIATAIASLSASPVYAQQRCKHGKSGGLYPCKKVLLQSLIPKSEFGFNVNTLDGLWGYSDPNDHREYAIVTTDQGTAVFDVTVPTKVRRVGTMKGGATDVKVASFYNERTGRWSAYGYIATGNGIQVVDLTKLPWKVSLLRTNRQIDGDWRLFISNTDFITGRIIEWSEPHLYVVRDVGEGGPAVVVFSLKNPRKPVRIGSYKNSGHQSFGVYAETFDQNSGKCSPGKTHCDILFIWAHEGIRVVDFTDKQAPITLGELTTYPYYVTPSSGWISADKHYLFSFDEDDEQFNGGPMRIRILSIDDLSKPALAATWSGRSTAIAYKGCAVGNKLFIAGFTGGLTVLDVSNPVEPRRIGFFDTSPETDEPVWIGAVSVYPYLPSKNILLSDQVSGLFVLKQQ